MASLVLFDGVCKVCNGFVTFVIARDSRGRFQFGALQSDAARRVLALHAPLDSLPDALVLVDEGRVFTRSAAVLRIAKRLSFPWPLAYAFIAVPRPLRDWVYDVVARHRYRWFGTRDRCMVPSPDIQSRFLE